MRPNYKIIHTASRLCTDFADSSIRHNLSCVIYDKRHNIIATGRNRRITFGKSRLTELKSRPNTYTIHAETDALVSALRRSGDLRGASAFVYRTNYNLAMPCENCYAGLIEAGIRPEHVYWSDNGRSYKYQSDGMKNK